MDKTEFKQIMIDLGFRKITDAGVAEMISAYDFNKDG